LASIGALEWQRLIGDLSSGHALLWVLVAVGAACGVLLVERVREGWLRAGALLAVVVVALFVGYWLSGAGLGLLKPRHWDDLFSGLGSGLQALGTVRLPYVSADPWPGIVLELLGAQLLILAGLLTFWPRTPSSAGTRVPLTPPDRGYPIVSLAVMLVVVASPVVSLGGTGARPLLLGLVLAGLTVCFLWLERLPFRPGLGVAGLLAVALVGALPIAALADRGEAWFDYRSFAESLGPDDPVRFSWKQGYGPISWPRDGNEVMRVQSSSPLYWKARNLDEFDGLSWAVRTDPLDDFGAGPFDADLPADWEENRAYTETIDVSVRRMRIRDVVGAGTTLEVRDASRDVQPGLSPGTYDAPSALRRGDSYTAEVYVPRPDQEQMAQSTSGAEERQRGERTLTVPFRPGETAPPSADNITPGTAEPSSVTEAVVRFGAWDAAGDDSAAGYPTLRRSEFNVEAVMERSLYARTWERVQELKRGKKTAMDYVRAVDQYLSGPEFRYVERPAQPPRGEAPLEYFINQSHEGYCQHYAGAMALMLRMGGVPARVATGFSPGGYSDRKKAWIVRDTDAHAWVEIWFDEYGWVTVDPTPAATPARSLVAALAPDLGSSTPGMQADTGAGDAASGDAPSISVRPELQTGGVGELDVTTEDSGPRWWLYALAVVLLVGVGLAIALFVRRPRGPTPMDRAIAEVEDALRRVGRPVTTGTTLIQLEHRLGSYSPEVSQYLRALAAGRYALAPAPPPREGRRALRRALAQGLGFGGRARALWALPPRIERGPRARSLEVDTRVRV
jgi:transglutaminase-like putative cysteine protease